VIRVLIAEDHGIVRAGLLQLLVNAADMEVVGLAARGVDAVELARATRPDVVLMDLAMPDLDGIEATGAIAEMAPQVRVLILTAFSDGPYVLAALDAGAAGYLLKDCDPDALYGAIRAIHRGEAPLAPQAASVVLAACRHDHAPIRPRRRPVAALRPKFSAR